MASGHTPSTIEKILLQYSINCFQNYYCNRYVFSPSAIRFFGQPQVVEPFDRCAQWAHRSNDTVAFFPIFGGALRAAAKNRKKCLKKPWLIMIPPNGAMVQSSIARHRLCLTAEISRPNQAKQLTVCFRLGAKISTKE